MLHNFVVHPLFQLAGFTVGIIGLLVGYYFYRQTRNRKALRFAHRDIALVTPPRNHGEAIAISYNGEPVSKLRRIGVLLWNTGDVTINFNEELQGISLILPKGYRILRAYVAASDDGAGGFSVEERGNTAELQFDYLRSKEGVLYYVDYAGRRGQVSIDIMERTRNLARRGFILVYPPPLIRLISIMTGVAPVVAFSFRAIFSATSYLDYLVVFAFLPILGLFLFFGLRGLSYGKAQALYSKEFGLP